MPTKLAIIMRGLPGSGKSYWVEQFITSQGIEQAIHIRQHGLFSTDRYFYQ
ncbi:ATP-binding protein, partial [Shewanella sp. 30m-9]